MRTIAKGSLTGSLRHPSFSWFSWETRLSHMPEFHLVLPPPPPRLPPRPWEHFCLFDGHSHAGQLRNTPCLHRVASIYTLETEQINVLLSRSQIPWFWLSNSNNCIGRFNFLPVNQLHLRLADITWATVLLFLLSSWKSVLLHFKWVLLCCDRIITFS